MKRRRFLLGGLAAGLAALAPASWAILRHPRFGIAPIGEELSRIQASPHFRNGKFHNLELTATISNNVGNVSVLWDFYFGHHERQKPSTPLPVVRSNLHAMTKDAVLWFGHSSWLLHLGGQRILIDPVFSDYAAPFSRFNRAFQGTSVYLVSDLPEIDLLLISHDHWDHLDYPTIRAILPKVQNLICPLGLKTTLTSWGYPASRVWAMDWNEQMKQNGLTVHFLPSRHFSGRLLERNKTLWGAFALESATRRVFYSGDSGYGPHFKAIGEQFKGFDLALMECGQYDKNWPLIHMAPEETAQALADVGAKLALPSHLGRFCISNHSWDDPYIRLDRASRNAPYQLATPKIGEILWLDAPTSTEKWWQGRV